MTPKTQADIYYQALQSRDPRFDGKFFVGVKTTGIYCRPICPAKPKRENVEFFQNRLEAERAGYRPCLRCRPESAPDSPTWIGKSAVVRRAIKILNTQDTIDFDEDRFADLFGVTARHLRRLFIEEIGKTPKQLSFENRLNLSRKLITETALPISEAAFAAGFKSIRRFNDAFKDRFKKSPNEIRRNKVQKSDGLTLSLSYRPPFDFEGLLNRYQAHQIGNLEWFTQGKMHRVVAHGKDVGTVTISNDAKNSKLIVEIDFPDTSLIHSIIARVRAVFDLDSDPVTIANQLEVDSAMKTLVKKHPGIRISSGWDGFETAVSTILGQFVSVENATQLVAALIEQHGTKTKKVINGKTIALFPTPKQIVEADLSALKTTAARKRTLVEFSKAVEEKRISLEPTQNVDSFVTAAKEIFGIGTWSADYMALKVLRHADAFPATDLILARALELHPNVIEKLSPWRGYAAALFWREYAATLKKTKSKQTKGKKK